VLDKQSLRLHGQGKSKVKGTNANSNANKDGFDGFSDSDTNEWT
jgi:hypothetical protein